MVKYDSKMLRVDTDFLNTEEKISISENTRLCVDKALEHRRKIVISIYFLWMFFLNFLTIIVSRLSCWNEWTTTILKLPKVTTLF